MFSFQMYQALTKYFLYPRFEQKGRMNIANVRMPSIYICPLNQYDRLVGEQLGYPYSPNLMAGFPGNSSDALWNVNNSSHSFQDVIENLYKVNLSDVELMGYKSYEDVRMLEYEKRFFFPYGTCLKIKDASLMVNETLEIGNTKRTKLILEDPLISNDFVIDEQPESVAELGPTYNGFYDYKYYNVHQQINLNHISDGQTCKNYEKIGSSYAECLKGKLEGKKYK